MPAVAVVAAIVADVVAVSAVAEVGFAAMSIVTALEVVGAVGATVSAVGAVTGDKTLSTVGMALGVVGGVGGAAASYAGAGGLGTSIATQNVINGPLTDMLGITTAQAPASANMASLFDAAGNAVAFDPSSLVINNNYGTGNAIAGTTMSGAAGSGDVIYPTYDSLSFAPAGADGMPAANVLGGLNSTNGGYSIPTTMNPHAPTGLPESGSSGLPASSLPETGMKSGESFPSGVGTGPSLDSTNTDPAAQGSANPGAYKVFDPSVASGGTVSGVTVPTAGTYGDVTGVAGGTSPSPTSTLGKLGAFAEKHPTLALGAFQAGASLISGMTDTTKPAQVAQLNAQAGLQGVQAQLAGAQTSLVGAQTQATQQQANNMAQPMPVASRTPYSTSSLINSQPTPFR